MAKSKGKSKNRSAHKTAKKNEKDTLKKAHRAGSHKNKVEEKPEPKTPKAPKTPETPLIANFKNKFASLLLILLGLLAVLFIGAFFVKKFLEPLDIADVLPAGETVMMANFDGFKLAGKKNRVDSLISEKKLPVGNLISILEEALNADFGKDISPWLGYRHGYALLETKGEDGVYDYEHILFIQSIDRQGTLEFLSRFQLESLQDSMTEERYNGYPIYGFSVGQNIGFLLLDKYFVFAKNTEVLKKIVDVKTGALSPLSGDSAFLTVRNNLKRSVGFVYYNPAKLFDYYISEPTSSMAFLRPVLSLLGAAGHSVIFDDSAIIVQTYMNFSGALSDESVLGVSAHYKGDLLKFIPSDFEYFWGSRDLSKIITEFGEVLNQLHPSSFNILEGILNAKKEQYFGYEADLREDIYKIFENEFALALYSRPDRIDYLFIAADQSQDNIYKLQAYYMAAMSDRGFEILEQQVGGEEGGSKSDQISVFPFDVWTNMYTAMHKGIFVMSTDISLVEDTLTGIDGNGAVVNKKLAINAYLKDFDEVNIMSPAFLSALLDEKWESYLSELTGIQAAKSIFPSGMALVHVFEF